MNNIIINKTARKEEFLAYTILKPYIFNNKKTIIGDEIDKNLPDIFTEDKSIGVEVCVCETFGGYKKIEGIFTGNLTLKDIENTRKIIKNVDKYPHLKLAMFKNNQNEFLCNFEKLLYKKITKLNNGEYSHCKSVNLIILCHLSGENINFKQIKNKLIQTTMLFSKKYDNIYITSQNNIYVFKNNQMNLLQKQEEICK